MDVWGESVSRQRECIVASCLVPAMSPSMVDLSLDTRPAPPETE